MNSASDIDCAKRLQHAIENRKLALAYQPKIHIASGTVSGVEALARFHDEELGSVPPSQFIPVAERFGLLDELTDFVLRTALSQWTRWREQGVIVRMAINVSALNLRDETLPDHVQRLCMLEGMPCDHLTIEITEGATLNIVRLLETLTRFRLKGFGVSLDDFGTGYSSLAQLRQLPYTEIKIDRCFVQDLTVSQESRTIVSAIISLAHAMRLIATAEGVEDAETLALLEALGCDEVQGFHVSRPLMGPAFVEWLLHSGRGWVSSRPAHAGTGTVEAADGSVPLLRNRNSRESEGMQACLLTRPGEPSSLLRPPRHF